MLFQKKRLFLIGILLCIAQPAPAQTPPSDVDTYPTNAAQLAEVHSRKGVEHYQAGEYPEAVAEMLLAYKQVADPALLYSIARIYEKLSEPDIAISYYQRFVVADGAEPTRVKKALEHVQRLKNTPKTIPEAIAVDIEDKAAAQPNTESPPVSEDPAPNQNAIADSEGPTMTEDEQHSNVLPFALMGIGAVTLGVGGYFGVQAQGALDDVDNLNLSYSERRKAQANGRDDAHMADILLLTGTALAVSGLVSYFLTQPNTEQKSAKTVSLVPVLMLNENGTSQFGLVGQY